ncbi:MAG TPA: NAD(P)-dependent oxidoreductase, partial [Polyangiaceae bacterium]
VAFGGIARRLAELLAPFHLDLVGLRRSVEGSEPIPVLPMSEFQAELAKADHVVNLLPDNASTRILFDCAAFEVVKPGACFYNVGRGTTVDQSALAQALERGQLQAAYLDVTDPEPLPADHPLWRIPNCYITPHSAGGHDDEGERLCRHFLGNLARFEAGAPLLDRVI